MQIILLKSSKLGRIGQVIEVANGYAKNCLIPRGAALPATENNKLTFQKKRQELEVERAAASSIFNLIADKLTDVVLSFIEKTSDEGKLYGSISNKQIAKVLSERVSKELSVSAAEVDLRAFKINHVDIDIPVAIKSCGLHQVSYKNDQSKFRFFVSVGATESDVQRYASNASKSSASQGADTSQEGLVSEETQEPISREEEAEYSKYEQPSDYDSNTEAA